MQTTLFNPKKKERKCACFSSLLDAVRGVRGWLAAAKPGLGHGQTCEESIASATDS